MATATEDAPQQKMVENIAYGLKILAPVKLPEVGIELMFFKNAPKLVSGELKPPSGVYSGEGRFWHAQKLAYLLLGKSFDMHEWTEDALQLFCEYAECAVTGPKSGGKTATAAFYALLFWLSSPTDSAVILTSTTVQGLRKRVWGEVAKMWRRICVLAPDANMIQSKNCLQATKGDDMHGIFGLAVASGQTEKALGRIIGFHPKHLLIIVDEMTDTPEAIVDACANLDKVGGEFQFIGIGNAKSRLDPHGKLCRPKAGWNSIGVDSDFWETENGACLHLDGIKSPNITLGKRKYPYLLDQKDVDRAIKKYGENSPHFWRFTRGFWPPDDLENKVITESMFESFPRCREQAIWQRGFRNVAALDPATGGDRCMLRIGRYGMGTDGRILIEFIKKIPIVLNAGSKKPIHFQIADATIGLCKDNGVEPECFGIDETGIGSGTADIIQRQWSLRIHRVNFNDRPSQRVVSDTNPTPCANEYYNFVTELWFAVRRFLEGDQLRGIDEEDIYEFASRTYDMKGTLYQVLPKPEMKKIIGRSPDLADADAILCEVVRRHGVNPSTSGMITHERNDQSIERANRANDFDSQANNYSGRDDMDVDGTYGGW